MKELIIANGEMVSGLEEMNNAISEHWKNIGGVNEVSIDENILFKIEQKSLNKMDDNPITEEIKKVCEKLKNGKAPSTRSIFSSTQTLNSRNTKIENVQTVLTICEYQLIARNARS